MKTYQCHKVVQAAKIVGVGITPNAANDCAICTDDGENHSFPRHQRFIDAMVGSYLVKYEDGYFSVSPAEAFEAGYVEVA